MYTDENTKIVALATPPGTSALAIIRVSGYDLTEEFKALTHRKPKDRYALFSKIYSPKNNSVIDEVVVTYFKSPKSFTGEDVIEISCHGGQAIKNSIIRACMDLKIKQAKPGEFSYRAFMNGKIDLLQAEAISSLIDSKSSKSVEHSLLHLNGSASKNLTKIRSDIIEVLSIIENELNFSEEEITHTSKASILEVLNDINFKIDNIINGSIVGKKIFSGIRIAILGRPNAGKSSLFNAILGQDRTIISSEAGTTRDTVESWFELEGIPICLIDTAGVWESSNNIDLLGIEKTQEEFNRADISLIVDPDNPGEVLGSKFFDKKGKKFSILIKSKSDLSPGDKNPKDDFIKLSSKNNDGIKDLLTTISKYIVDNLDCREIDKIMITQRQIRLLEISSSYILTAINQIEEDLGADIVASTLHSFTDSIKEVIGDIPNHEIIDNIFSSFCVGK